MNEADLPEQPEFENPDADAARIDQQNSGSMAGGQQGTAGNNNVQNQGNNNSFGDTYTYQLIFSSQPPSNVVSRRAEEQVLLQVIRAEVADRLNTSLHQAVFINLTKDGQRDRVLRPWDREIKVNHGEQLNIPLETGIAEVFRQTEIGKKLLILGKPGAGKTTTLLDLAQGLIQIAEQNKDEPIPVLFNLSAWKNTMRLRLRERNSNDTAEWDSIALWLIDELKSKYGVSNQLAQQWLKRKKLLPLLDGLDEVAPDDQASCIKAVNTFLTGNIVPPGLTVCCREEEYELIVKSADKTRLQLNGAVCLKPLTEAQLQAYLQRTDSLRLWQPIHQDKMLLDLVKTPLWLSIVLLAQHELNLDEWQLQDTEADKKQLLLDAYFMQRIPVSWANCSSKQQPKQYPKGNAPTREQTRKWLVILAKQLQEQSKDEFLIEEMQPRDWLKISKQKWQYRLIGGLIFGLIFGLDNISTVDAFDFNFLRGAQKIKIVFKSLF